ncbi:MAG: thiamine pyrophosphate-dependent acetolactate synthase large subunit-like protein [Acidimicrobiales bacterium]|jgi:thiamine pyrophosphate-dependent acetolactate synthase large subunit-like protein
MLDRRKVTAALLADRGDLLVIAGLGAPNWDVTAVGDNDLNFPLWGAMGGAAMTGLGVALAQPDRRVLVITGDGEALMGLTALSTIGANAPGNLAIAVLDNERYGETGMQVTNTSTVDSPGTDLAAVALACGFVAAVTASADADMGGAVELMRSTPGPTMAVFKISADVPPQVVPSRDGPYLVQRFRSALGIS